MCEHRLISRIDVLFTFTIITLAFLPVISGEITTTSDSRKHIENDALSREYQFRVETYFSRRLCISTPANASNVSLLVTSFDLFGNTLAEEKELALRSESVTLGLGRYIVDLKFRTPRNGSISTDAYLTFENALLGPFPQTVLISVSLVCSLFFLVILVVSETDNHKQIVRSFKIISYLIARFQVEIASKQLKLGYVESMRISYSSLYPNIRKLRTIAEIDSFISSNMQLSDSEERRAALILQAIANVADEIRKAASRYQVSIAFSLEQVLDRSLISSVYRPKVDSLVQSSKGLKYTSEIKEALNEAQVLMNAETDYVRLAKILGALAVGILATIILGYQPMDLLIIKLPTLFYTLTNLLSFITHVI